MARSIDVDLLMGLVSGFLRRTPWLELATVGVRLVASSSSSSPVADERRVSFRHTFALTIFERLASAACEHISNYTEDDQMHDPPFS
jgi:hypothetical protein